MKLHKPLFLLFAILSGCPIHNKQTKNSPKTIPNFPNELSKELSNKLLTHILPTFNLSTNQNTQKILLKIRKIHITSYRIKDTTRQNKELILKVIINHNKENKKFSIEEHNLESSTKNLDVFKYDNKGNILEHLTYENGIIDFKDVYKYDENNRLIEKVIYHQGDYSKIKYQYDENNNLIAIKDNTTIKTLKYDKNNHLIEEKHYKRGIFNLFKALTGKSVYKYNDKGLLIEKMHFYENNLLAYKHAYKYDDMGNLIEEKRVTYGAYESSVPEAEQVYNYKYDAQNHLIERSAYNNANITWKQLYKYDKDGNLIEQIEYNYTTDSKLLSKIATCYQYDKYGLPMRETMFVNDTLFRITEWEIIYYE